MEPFDLVPVEFDARYTITIDPNNKLPLEINQTWGEADRITTKFSNWNLKPSPPADSIWQF
jgi:outer membrane lipoprotein-sorting protein